MMSHVTIDSEFRQRWRKVGIFTLLSVCMLSISIGIVAQTEREPPRMSAQRTSEEIKVDGVLDEPAWQNVEPIRELYQIQPNQGEPATEQSEVHILYDDKKLYFGFIFFDSEMDKVVANDMRRDSQRFAVQRLRVSAVRHLQ